MEMVSRTFFFLGITCRNFFSGGALAEIIS